MNRKQCKIVAPASDSDQAARLLEAGADELYCGILIRDWIRLFSDADFFTRRQGRFAHFTRWENLKTTVDLVHNAGRTISLALNQRYSPVQERVVLEAAETWEAIGGDALIVSDPGLLYFLKKEKSRLNIHLSLLTGVFNASCADFFQEWNVSRIIMPRELTIAEMEEIISVSNPGLEFEAMVLHQKCPFIDGMCGFYHATRMPEDTRAAFEHVEEPNERFPMVMCPDPSYEGHGCQLRWTGPHGPVKLSFPEREPSCAACQFPRLFNAGITCYKLGGRGYRADVLEQSVRFIDAALNAWSLKQNKQAPNTVHEMIKKEYVRAFGEPCGFDRCYYRI